MLTPVRNQLFRGTCVAFATVALLEAKIRREQNEEVDLSEQYVYFRARQKDPDRREDGTYSRYALDALVQFGACREALLPYEPYNDWGQSQLFQQAACVLSNLDPDAQQNRIRGWSSLSPNSLPAIKQAILNDQPVCASAAVFYDAWYDNGVTETIGEVQMPLSRPNPDGTETVLDVPVGGHAFAIVGYKDTPDPDDLRIWRPGGGFFIFKNSWGTIWAPQCLYGAGFGILPYSYIEKYNWFAEVIT